MTVWWTLYLKELKENRITFGFLILATLCAGLYSLMATTEGRLNPRIAVGLIPFLTIVVLPFLLLHSFSQEFKGQTHYQLLALPVQRWAIALCKVAAFLSVGAVVAVLAGSLALVLRRFVRVNNSAISGD